MRQAIFLPAFDELADAALVGELGELAEARGWDGFFVWDHVQYLEPVELIADPWMCLAAVALRTERVRIGPLVTPLARRRPWVLARQAATVDRLSGGRLVLGFGVGADNRGEMGPFGEGEIGVRAEMLEEGLGLLEEIFSGGPVEHTGRHYSVSARAFLPRPVQTPIPVWIGAAWPGRRAIDRAARCDGVFPLGIVPGEVATLRERIAALRADEAGHFEIVTTAYPGDDPGPWREAGADWLLTHLGPRPRPAGGFDPTPTLAAVRAVIEAGPV